jgi:hypothetical protein
VHDLGRFFKRCKHRNKRTRVTQINDRYTQTRPTDRPTTGHDPNDYEIGKRRDLETINIMNRDGTMNELAGPYSGLDRFDARKRLWGDMEAAGLAIKTEPYTMRCAALRACERFARGRAGLGKRMAEGPLLALAHKVTPNAYLPLTQTNNNQQPPPACRARSAAARSSSPW